VVLRFNPIVQLVFDLLFIFFAIFIKFDFLIFYRSFLGFCLGLSNLHQNIISEALLYVPNPFQYLISKVEARVESGFLLGLARKPAAVGVDANYDYLIVLVGCEDRTATHAHRCFDVIVDHKLLLAVMLNGMFGLAVLEAE